MLEVSEKDFKAAMIKMFQWVTSNTVEMNEKSEGLSNTTGSLTQETAHMKNQMKNLELKTITTNKKLKG